tara:strand:+ start:209 stop:1018 length:810 start_codon:yes stop_codon:yes gene_type:complete
MIKCGLTGFNGNLGKTFTTLNNKFKYINFKGDISKKNDINKWIKENNFDLLIHFAALVPTSIVNKQYRKALKTNYIGTKYLVDAILRYNKSIDWFFFASTSHVYPQKFYKINEKHKTKPSSKYGKTKLLAEKYIEKKLNKTNIKFCIGRIFSIIDNKGEQFLLNGLLSKIKKKEKIIILKNLNHYRDFLTTEQISKIILMLWKRKVTGLINIGSGIKTNLQSIAKIFAIKAKKKLIFKFNKPTYLVANVSKLKKIGFKPKKLNFVRFFY